MNTSAPSSDNPLSPLPARQLRWFGLFFHSVFIGGMAISVILHWRKTGNYLPRTDLLLLPLVVIQVTGYLLLFALPGYERRWLNRWWLAGYFVSGVTILLIECHLDGAFCWLVGVYLAHILALPWRLALPGTLLLFVGFFLTVFGWGKLVRFSPLEWLIALGTMAAWTGLLLFLHRAVATSTERGQLIVALEATKRDLEAARQRDAELATLRERERLARELHDSLGHSLVTLTVQLEAAQRLLTTDPARADALISEMQKLTRSGMEELRRSLANLRASGLGDRALGTALKELCVEASQRAGFNIACEISEGSHQPPPLVVEALWRMAQEGLTNAEKHSRARVVRLQLDLRPTEAVLQVSDDGIGLPAGAEEKPGHFGLRGMRERLEGVGGTLTMTGGASGTIIEARIPMILG